MKKYFTVIILLTGILGASYEKKPDVFYKLKKTMLPSLERILPMYSEFSHCYEKQKSKKNYIFCTKSYAPKVEKIVKKMLQKTGQDEKNVSHFPTDEQLQAFSWNTTLHNKTIYSIQAVTKQMQELKNCLSKSHSLRTFNTCTKDQK